MKINASSARVRFAPAKIIRDRSFAHFRVDIAVPLTRLKDETYRNNIRFLMEDEVARSCRSLPVQSKTAPVKGAFRHRAFLARRKICASFGHCCQQEQPRHRCHC